MKAHLKHSSIDHLESDLLRIANSKHHDPFSVLGLHEYGRPQEKKRHFIAYRPTAEKLSICHATLTIPLERIENSDFFYTDTISGEFPEQIKLRERSKNNSDSEFYDPYCFAPVLSEENIVRFGGDADWQCYQWLGAHLRTVNGIEGLLFAVWAPNAERVSVVGDFNHWDGRVHPMRCRGSSGIWELFIPDSTINGCYKYEIRCRHSGEVLIKSDPYANTYEMRPNTASCIRTASEFGWQDDVWMARRAKADWLHQPMNIYEVHLSSWQRDEFNHYLNYRELAHRLVDYAKQHHFTHLELLPITEYPYDGSWGYQVTGYFAPTSRCGSPDDFRYFVDYCHQHQIGIILDWVPAHFPKDAHGLARFDGTALYEHHDPRLGEHRDWDTLIFNYGRREVANFLLASAYYWLHEFHLDGLRVDAVASMLYLDYSRQPGEWLPNRFGSNENLEAIEFLRSLNCILHEQCPGSLIIAEESTSWPQVSRPVYLGGLGFSMKWNMGWMNDTLQYFSQDPVFRQYNHDNLTFGLLYAFSENFVLPLSHDEVVHGKCSILNKMPGDAWQQFANMRLLYSYMYAYPGKKLLFMGNEIAQGREWDHDQQLDWDVLQYPLQQGVQQLVKDLGKLYVSRSALHARDFEADGFQWIDCHDNTQSVISFLRRSAEETLIAVFNFTPVPRYNYRIGVPDSGRYQEIFNSDSCYYAGSNVSNGTRIDSEPYATMGFSDSISLTLPPLAALYLTLSN